MGRVDKMSRARRHFPVSRQGGTMIVLLTTSCATAKGTPCPGIPTAVGLATYFGEMGYLLEDICGDGRQGEVQRVWRLHRASCASPFKDFGSLESLWSWWKHVAAGLIMADSRFRLFCSLYRSACEAERAEMRVWAADCAQRAAAGSRVSEPFGRWRRYTAEGLPPEWAETACHIELESLSVGEHWSHRFLRAALDFDEALVRSALAAAIPLSKKVSCSRRI